MNKITINNPITDSQRKINLENKLLSELVVILAEQDELFYNEIQKEVIKYILDNNLDLED